MARDRNVYVWQAYVTVMSIVSVACLGALVFVLFQSGTSAKTVEGALAREQKATEELRKSDQGKQVLEHILGVGTQLSDPEFEGLVSGLAGDEKLNSAVKAYTANKALFGQGASDKSFSKLVETLMLELRNKNKTIEDAAKKEIEMRSSYDETIARETKAREAEKQKAQDFANKADQELTKYTENIATQQQLITNIDTEKKRQAATFTAKIGELNKSLEDSKKENEDMKKRLDQLVSKLDAIKGEDFQYAQGKITEVADGGRTVYINLGKADRLRPGVSFGVIDADVTRFSEAKPKAKIEVIAVVDEHLSRCKVLSDRIPAIILTGDAIYSPAWLPGKEVEFALVGKMDIDGDGRDDREVLKALLRQNGAKVSADLPPNGKLEGALSVDTSYLVMGEEFKVRGSELDATAVSAADARNKLEAQARSMAISKINLNKLLGWIRGGSANEVIPIGNAQRSKAEDYLKTGGTNDSNNNGRVSELFQSRDGKLNRQPPNQ
jgi:hypothetical protein